jgi:hypothetical protein
LKWKFQVSLVYGGIAHLALGLLRHMSDSFFSNHKKKKYKKKIINRCGAQVNSYSMLKAKLKLSSG